MTSDILVMTRQRDVTYKKCLRTINSIIGLLSKNTETGVYRLFVWPSVLFLLTMHTMIRLNFGDKSRHHLAWAETHQLSILGHAARELHQKH